MEYNVHSKKTDSTIANADLRSGTGDMRAHRNALMMKSHVERLLKYSRGLEKLEKLASRDDGWGERVENPAFETGFHTLIFDGQRSKVSEDAP